MTWVNLNDVYVSKSGGTISGDLAVNGTLTINDKTGNGTTYDVANQISTLRDSVSQDTGWLDIYPKDAKGAFVRYRRKLNVVYLIFSSIWGIESGNYWKAGTLPSNCSPAYGFYSPLCMRQSNNAAMAWVGSDGEVGLYPMTKASSDCSNSVSGIVSWPI